MLPGLSAAAMLMAGGKRPPAFRNLASLFNGGAVDGIMIDFTDKTTLFQDANGAAAVVNNGDSIGLALDQRKWSGQTLAAYRAAQPEKITNPEFTSDIGAWNVSATGIISWVSGKLRLTVSSGNPYFYQSFTTIIGRWYEASVVFDSRTGTGNPRLLVGSSAGDSALFNGVDTFVAPGIYRRWFKATSTTTFLSIQNLNASTSSDWESVSVKEIDGHHATQATLANRPLWQSATNDALFDGSNDSLITDFYFRSNGNFLASWQHLARLSGTYCTMGAIDTSPSAFATLRGTGSMASCEIGSSTGPSSGTANIYNRSSTMLATQTASLAALYVDGVSDATKGTPGDFPDVADAVPVAIGARNSNGTINVLWDGRIKRVVAGQLDLTGVMSALDFHENLIAA